ncbi:MAG TPA: phospholipase D-like domain-containing protein [Verrucomicrobiae bacterium]|nr:phospholipase D-like domain-containing protein [Verrucomicrobiae bacterium]
MEWQSELAKIWNWLVIVLTVVLALLAAGHAVLYRRESRAAVLWVGVIMLVPLIGATLYFILGVNRIRRRAILLRSGLVHMLSVRMPPRAPADGASQWLPEDARHLGALANTVGRVAERPLLRGNQITPLQNGDEAYPAMLAAIESAQHTVTLSTYIFDRDEAGVTFAKALGNAVRRGVEVRVLIDATGTRYSWPPILGVLRKEKVRYARFLPTFPLWRLLSINLRCHRKTLVVDGRIGFTGGMNIRVGHWHSKNSRHPIQDLHFRIEGPVVSHLQEVFAEDWLFTTGESLQGKPWFPELDPAGPAAARAIADGPDEDPDPLRWTIQAALAAAQRSVKIMTPYFLPDQALISSLNLAALRGVRVEIVLPEKNNLHLVAWASQAMWWQVLDHGCSIFLSAPPFDHTKLMVVDNHWSLVGSANWDPRSFRLNFELDVECYDATLAGQLTALFDARRATAREVTLNQVDGRALLIRLRDGVARLFTPFL